MVDEQAEDHFEGITPSEFDKSAETALLPLVKDPVVFDGTELENVLRKAMFAYCELHSFEFVKNFKKLYTNLRTNFNLLKTAPLE